MASSGRPPGSKAPRIARAGHAAAPEIAPHPPQPGNGAPRPSQGRRKRAPAASAERRRQAILDAALAVFSRSGFASARLDDVAREAGLAKGTLYLYFPSKEALFEALIRAAAAPILDRAVAMAALPDITARDFLAQLLAVFQRDVLATDRKLVIRLLVSEGHRFPEIAAFYHREVVSRGVALLRCVAERAVARGELAGDEIVRFPQLVMAPLLLSVVWDGLFGAIEPLDVAGLLEAHHRLLTPGNGARP